MNFLITVPVATTFSLFKPATDKEKARGPSNSFKDEENQNKNQAYKQRFYSMKEPTWYFSKKSA